MKNFNKLIAVGLFPLMLSSCFGSNESSKNSKKTSFVFGDKINFNDLELTFEYDFLYEHINNQFSEHNGDKAFGVPVKMTNKKDEPHSLNMFYYTCYGPNGSELDNVSAYFDEDTSMDWGGKILPGVTATRYLYFLYAGDGAYKIYLDDFSTKLSIDFNFTYIE